MPEGLGHWLAMGGYGAFVWPAYAIALVGLAALLGSALIAHRRAQKAVSEAERTKT